jgi:hypothetical protein
MSRPVCWGYSVTRVRRISALGHLLPMQPNVCVRIGLQRRFGTKRNLAGLREQEVRMLAG